MRLDTITLTEIKEENQRLREENKKLKQKERYLQLINDFASSLLVKETEDEIVWDIAKNAIARLSYLDCVVYLMSPSSKYLIQKAAHGPKNPIDFDILNPIRIKIGEGIAGAVAETGIPEIITDTREDKRYIPDEVIGLSEIAVPIIDSSNKVLGVIDSEHPEIGFFDKSDLDILTTIAAIAATKLVQARAKTALKLSNQNLEQFAYIASHDLKEPIRTISNFTQLLQLSYAPQLETKGVELLGAIVSRAKQMNQMIQDLLTFSRIEKGAQIKCVVDCNDVLKSVLKNLQSTIENNNAEISSVILPKIEGIFSQFVQLFQNLINNAIKFRQVAPPQIHITVKDENSHFLFSVTDNGIGIKEEYQQQIFTIFNRLHDNSTFEGSGIGLATCKKIVEQHGGHIWVKSYEGKGSTFFFTIAK